MASTMATVAAHQTPPLNLALGSRIRPPRLLKGAPHPNNNQSPEGQRPEKKVWVQGKWRDPSSNAAAQKQYVESRQIEKAVRLPDHGTSIYAYSHIRTNQVVYSLTRILQNSNVLHQLLFHGKKTVPESVRRDMWTPYFSIHFPPTATGAQSGLLTYRRLRELSVQRQLSPPKDLLMTTQADVDRYKAQSGDPMDVREAVRRGTIKLPQLNQMLPKRLRASKLMDQKASSVADLAFVLDLHNKDVHPRLRLHRINVRAVERYKELSRRARRRLRPIREQEAKKLAKLEERLAKSMSFKSKKTDLPLDKHVIERISMSSKVAIAENERLVYSEDPTEPGRTITPSDSPSQKASAAILDAISRREKLSESITENFTKEWNEQHRPDSDSPPFPRDILSQKKKDALKKFDAEEEPRLTEMEIWEEYKALLNNAEVEEVKILWSDIRDGTYAQTWPKNVYHGELDRFNVSKKQQDAKPYMTAVDEKENVIESVNGPITTITGRSVHVIGSDQDEGWPSIPTSMTTPSEDSDLVRDRIYEYFAMQQIRKLRNTRRIGGVVDDTKPRQEWHGLREYLAQTDARLDKLLQPAGYQSEDSLNSKQSESLTQDGQKIANRVSHIDSSITRLFKMVRKVSSNRETAFELARLEEQYPDVSRREDRHDLWVSKAAERRRLLGVIESYERESIEGISAEADQTALQMREARTALSNLDNEFPQFDEMDARRQELANTIEARKAEIERMMAQAEAEKDRPEETRSEKSVQELSEIQKEDEKALASLESDYEREFRFAGSEESKLWAVTGGAGSGTSVASLGRTMNEGAKSSQRTLDVNALREQGIEVDEPSRGVWGRIKGFFGR